MDPVKAAFLQAVINQGKEQDQSNFIPFLMAMQKNAKERNITFSKQETDFIYDQLKEKLSPSDRQQMEFLRTIMQKNFKNSPFASSSPHTASKPQSSDNHET